MKQHSGIIFYYKPKNITSFDLVRQIKSKLEKKYEQKIKIGHTGTLDKFAEGLMILLVQDATAFSEYFLGLHKTYIAGIQLGKQTDTLDPEGNIIQEWDQENICEFVNKNQIRIIQEIENLKNIKFQVPPEYSAVKIKGKRASDWIREGVKVDLKLKQIKIFYSKLIQLDQNGKILVEFKVSSGTYIRSIARDLGKILGIPSMLYQLIRTSIDRWSINDNFISNEQNIQLLEVLELLNWDQIQLNPKLIQKVKNGVLVPLHLKNLKTKNFFIIDSNHKIISWCKKINEKEYKFKKVFTE